MFFTKNKKNGSKADTKFVESIDDTNKSLSTESVKELLQESSDVTFRELYINGRKDLPVTMVFIDGLVNSKSVDDDILKPLAQEMILSQENSIDKIISHIEHGSLYHASQKTRTSLKDCVNDIIDGSVALIFDKVNKAITFNIKGFDKRPITEPTGENIIKGAKDSFIEDLRTNTATIRRKIKTANLVFEELTVGKQTLTKVAVVYIRGITNKHIVEELKKRLDKIDYDSVLTSGVIEEGIIDNKSFVFPQVMYTERPDKFCSAVVQGRVGLIVDGVPAGLAVPVTLNVFLQTPEDYSQNFIVSSIIRFIRYGLVCITLLLPSFYVSVLTFHQEMIPTELAIAIKASKQGIPFPSFMEVIFMLIAFEILIEAGLRLPKNIGQAVSIVGAIVVGQSAVEAKLVSPSVVAVIALTAISSFSMPNQDFSNALRVWRFVFVILSSILGLYALSLGAIILLIELSRMETFGIPYLSPFVSQENKQMQDSIFRLPFSSMYKRPIELKTTNKRRS